MTYRIITIALLVATTSAPVGAQNHSNRRRGAILGGLAGAAIGAAIGDKGNNETAGALIGGAVGAVAGGTIGDAKDQRVEHNRRYHSGYSGYAPSHGSHNHYPAYRGSYSQQHVYSVPPPPPPVFVPAEHGGHAISIPDVLAMVRGGLSETMVIQQIQLRGMQRPLAVSEVISLHQQGVSEPIINAMQAVFASPNGSLDSSDRSQSVYGEPTPGRSYRVPTTPDDTYGPSIVGPANGR